MFIFLWEQWLTFLTARVGGVAKGGRDIGAAQPYVPLLPRGMTPFLLSCQVQFTAARRAIKEPGVADPAQPSSSLGSHNDYWRV